MGGASVGECGLDSGSRLTVRCINGSAQNSSEHPDSVARKYHSRIVGHSPLGEPSQIRLDPPLLQRLSCVFGGDVERATAHDDAAKLGQGKIGQRGIHQRMMVKLVWCQRHGASYGLILGLDRIFLGSGREEEKRGTHNLASSA